MIFLYTSPSHPPPHIFQAANMFLLLFRMSLRNLNGWLAIIQKFERTLCRCILSLTFVGIANGNYHNELCFAVVHRQLGRGP